jgi:hypothetical protein
MGFKPSLGRLDFLNTANTEGTRGRLEALFSLEPCVLYGLGYEP